MNLNNWQLDITATLFVCIFFPLFIYFSYWLFISGIIGLYRMIKSRKWKSTLGKITNAEIKYTEINVDHETSSRAAIVKEYTYTVDGKEYKSDQTYASDSLFSKDYKTLNKPSTKYDLHDSNMNFINSDREIKNMIGTPTRVYYNPKKPHKACLVPRVHGQIFIGIFMGLIASSGITYLTFYFIKPLFN